MRPPCRIGLDLFRAGRPAIAAARRSPVGSTLSHCRRGTRMSHASDTAPARPRGLALHTRILIGFVVGVVAGVLCYRFAGADSAWLAGTVTYVTQPLGQIFLRLLLMLVIPLLFSALVLG